MPFSATFNMALRLLDRNQVDRAEALLIEAIAETERAGDDIGLVQALVCLGDALHMTGRGVEAVPLLQRALSLRRDQDVLAVEFDRASELLDQIGGA